MVYGRILYNNIREYTPKSFPTIPYSQTTKPVFGTPYIMQVVAFKSSPNGTRNLPLSAAGVCSDGSSSQDGNTRCSCSV